MWTRSPPFRPPYRPPLRPHVERSAAADSASTETGSRSTTNWPSRCTRRTRKGGVRRQACVAGHLRPDVRRFGDEHVSREGRADTRLRVGAGIAAGGRRGCLCPIAVAARVRLSRKIVAASIRERHPAGCACFQFQQLDSGVGRVATVRDGELHERRWSDLRAARTRRVKAWWCVPGGVPVRRR